MADSTIPEVMDKLRDSFASRLSGVTVTSAPMEPKVQGIELIRVEEEQDFAGMRSQASGGPTRDEQYAVIGQIWTTENGSGESVAKKVRDRAFSYLSEISDYLRDTPKLGIDEVLWSHLSVTNMTQGWVSQGSRNCELRFRIQVHARI